MGSWLKSLLRTLSRAMRDEGSGGEGSGERADGAGAADDALGGDALADARFAEGCVTGAGCSMGSRTVTVVRMVSFPPAL